MNTFSKCDKELKLIKTQEIAREKKELDNVQDNNTMKRTKMKIRYPPDKDEHIQKMR